MRVPFNGLGAPLVIFTTHDPDTGAAVNADSLPTATSRDGYSTWTAGGLDLLVVNIETGVYAVIFDSDAWAASEPIYKPMLVIVSATVGGITQKIVEYCEAAPPSHAGVTEAWASNSATAFRANLYSQSSGTALDVSTDQFIGSLICFTNGTVRRITDSANVDSNTVLLTVDSALSWTPAGGESFWIVTI